jgi:hypothetical protein
MGLHMAYMGVKKMHAGFWWERPEKRALGRAMYKWEDNIKIDIYKITNKMYHVRYL